MNRQKFSSEFEVLNRFAHTDGIVLLGSTSAAHVPLNELIQDFGLDNHVYNRSVPELTIAGAEEYVQDTICQLEPEKLLLNLGEVELSQGTLSMETMMEQYQWLLYRIHTMLPKTRIVLISVDAQIPGAASFNQELKALCHEYGCEYANVSESNPSNEKNWDYEIDFFHAIKPFFYHRTMSLSDALHYCAV